MASGKLRDGFHPRVHRGVHRSEQAFFRAPKHCRDNGESDITDDHEIDIARVDTLAASKGPIDEGPRDAIRDGIERVTQDIDQSDGLEQETLQIWEQWTLAVGLKVDAVPVATPAQNSR